jgi:galactonate dehydratase
MAGQCAAVAARLSTMRVTAIESRIVHVNARTNWYFVRVRTDAGIDGIGEASLNGYERLLDALLADLSPRLVGAALDDGDEALATYPHATAGLVSHALKSAIRQAYVDARARADGVPAWQLLGGAKRDRVPVYANVNRATRDRSPAGCAASARSAVAQGFRAIKIAPFDNVFPHALDGDAARQAIDAGIGRVSAMREAVGPDVALMVDCHWRFDEHTALEVLERLAGIGLHWFECPVSEQPGAHAALARVREAAEELGVLVAACELQTAVEGFRPFVEPRRVDAIMPDVKYCGGPFEMLRIARYADAHGVRFSPHNPTGPVCTLASLHVAIAAPAVESLELQVGESPLTRGLVGGVEPALVDGAFVAPGGIGWGVDLDERVAAAHPYQPVAPGLDERLG